MKASKILSRWFFETLAGTFVEGTTLYVSAQEAERGELGLSGTVDAGNLTIAGYSITNGQVYPLATKKDIKGAYIIYDSIEISYDTTKDGTYPSAISARLLCVDGGFTTVEALADAVEDKMRDAWVPALDSTVELLTRRSDYDSNTNEYLEEIRIRLQL